MTGRAEVGRLKRRLDASFERIRDVGPDLELHSDFARYLCVLVSGYLEKAVVELVLEHARNSGGPTLQRFVEIRTRRFANANASRLIEFLGSFNPDWRAKLEVVVIYELKDAVDSVVRLKNTIAHGESVGVTYRRIEEYYARVQRVIDEVADLCVPR
jgi:hypothetical protein